MLRIAQKTLELRKFTGSSSGDWSRTVARVTSADGQFWLLGISVTVLTWSDSEVGRHG
jgi:hypothetical protein